MRIYKSILSMSSLKALDFIFPLLIIPLAIKTYGISNYGIISLFQTISMMFSNIIEFGFSVVGLQKISTLKKSTLIAKYLYSSIIIKGIILVILAPLYFLFAVYSPYSQYYNIYIIFFIIPLLSIFNFQWYYQAKFKYNLLICISLFSRVFSLILFITISSIYDNILILAICLVLMYSLPSIFYVMDRVKKEGIKRAPVLYIILVFKSNLSIFAYRGLNLVLLPMYVYILGFIFSGTQLGILGVVQRIMGATLNFSSAITQAIIPHITKEYKLFYKKRALFRKKINKFIIFFLLFGTITTLFVPIFIIVLFKLSNDDYEVYDLLLPLVLCLSLLPHILNSFLNHILILYNYSNLIFKSLNISIFISTPITLFLLYTNKNMFIITYPLIYWIFMILLLSCLRKKDTNV
ncbi:oligosaccharide flippase family protein [Proteus vulgaris]|uniref:lipopolysaccharide biosynthesis protein n=1 Tax=Proteus vulgaris TaxID=585 RepID=UPI0028758B44|nr:oligosaccharide flippase family protein [Proteus vulgaris]MDS0788087.1 oligosaccharide flippase family protein [Proteus vulgaris]